MNTTTNTLAPSSIRNRFASCDTVAETEEQIRQVGRELCGAIGARKTALRILALSLVAHKEGLGLLALGDIDGAANRANTRDYGLKALGC